MSLAPWPNPSLLPQRRFDAVFVWCSNSCICITFRIVARLPEKAFGLREQPHEAVTSPFCARGLHVCNAMQYLYVKDK